MWTSIPVLLCFAISCRKNVGADATGKTAPRAATSTFKVIGYLPSWSGSVSAIQFSKLTHINYAFLIPNSDGSLQAIDDASKLQSMASAAGEVVLQALSRVLRTRSIS
jgi:GH18 family chitinase